MDKDGGLNRSDGNGSGLAKNVYLLQIVWRCTTTTSCCHAGVAPPSLLLLTVNALIIMIVIESKRKKLETLRRRYPNAVIADVTSQATDGLVKLSPFYPHGDIPIPFTEGMKASCVEVVWQGLKVFETADVDVAMFANSTMKNIKRTVRRFGKPLGHRKGVYGTELLDYREVL